MIFCFECPHCLRGAEVVGIIGNVPTTPQCGKCQRPMRRVYRSTLNLGPRDTQPDYIQYQLRHL